MKKWWILSITVAVIFVFLIGFVLNSEHSGYQPNDDEVTGDAAVENYLEQIGLNETETSDVGIYISALDFASSNDVEVTGYIWQTMSQADVAEFGLIFPDAIGSVTMEQRYTHETDDALTIGWYFEAALRQSFDYSKYPIDHKTVWVRIVPSDFNDMVVLTPDLDAYNATGLEDSFGVSGDIVLIGWNLTETFFDYNITQYDTTFGLGESYVRSEHPELYYNVVIERDFSQALFVNITLIFIVMALLFSLLLMIISDEDKLLNMFGMSASGAIGTASALFFTVLLAHIDLRSNFGGQLVYLEFFYYIAYVFILAVSIIIFIFMSKVKNGEHPVVKSNASLMKYLYWPVFTGVMLIITYFWM